VSAFSHITFFSQKVYEKMNGTGKPFLLDLRGTDEYEYMRLGIGEVLIPLGVLCKRLHELPENKEAEIICFFKNHCVDMKDLLSLLQTSGKC
jgi:hypothetical protein